MEITFISNSDKLFLYQFNCIKYIIREVPNVIIRIYISSEYKLDNLLSNKIIERIDKRFFSLNEKPLDEIDLNEIKTTCNYDVITEYENLKVSDWVVFLYSDSKSHLYRAKSKNGFLRFKDFITYSYIQTIYSRPYTQISIEYNSMLDNTWQIIDKMNLKTEIGIYNNRDKALLNIRLLLLRVLNRPNDEELDRHSKPIDCTVHYNFFILLLYYTNLILKLVKRKLRVKKFNWKIVLKDNQNVMKYVDQPAHSFWADPFLVKFKNKIYVFIEELNWNTNLGHISMLELNEQYKVSRKKIILQRNYHMSYPNVFFHKNEFYMIPETSQINKLSIYKCTKFPDEWIHEMDLFDNTKLVDATWVYYNNLYWLFANKIEDFENDNNEKLYLYYSDDLFSKAWKAHPLNPIVTDASCARSAGKIYCEKNKLFRPSQNCLNTYGESIIINEIVELSIRDYKEKKISEICPEKGYLGVHTINFEGGEQVFDYLVLE